MTLSAAHLADLVDSFNGSYVLAIAACRCTGREWIDD
jgi:hypothetical protein